MPQLGESIAEAAIISFLVSPGDQVEADQNIIEVETNKATMTVTAPCSGQDWKNSSSSSTRATKSVPHSVTSKRPKKKPRGLVLMRPHRQPSETGRITETISKPESGTTKSAASCRPSARLPVPANAAGASYLSPRLKARMDELGLHAADLSRRRRQRFRRTRDRGRFREIHHEPRKA